MKYNYRYTVIISFKHSIIDSVAPIKEHVKTLKEAKEFDSLIDETVDFAYIRDEITGKITYLKFSV
jgi:hypothetical protein